MKLGRGPAGAGLALGGTETRRWSLSLGLMLALHAAALLALLYRQPAAPPSAPEPPLLLELDPRPEAPAAEAPAPAPEPPRSAKPAPAEPP